MVPVDVQCIGVREQKRERQFAEVNDGSSEIMYHTTHF